MSTSSSQPSVRFYSRVYWIWCYTNSILVFLSFTLHTALFSKCYCGFGANRYICSLLLQKVMLSWGELQTSMCYLCERWCLLLFLKTWTGRRANDWGVTCELPPSFTPLGASTVTNRQESLMQQHSLKPSPESNIECLWGELSENVQLCHFLNNYWIMPLSMIAALSPCIWMCSFTTGIITWQKNTL